MIFTIDDLNNLSRLARVDIDENKKEKMLADMSAILGYVSEINDLALDEVTPSYELINVMREDIVTRETGAMTEVILANAPMRKGDYVEVAQVLK